MARIEYINDQNGSFQEAHGSDGRLNVSSRSDGRRYYNSRDSGQTYSAVYTHFAATDGEFCFYLKNTSADKTLVVSAVGMNCDTADSRFKLSYVTGTAGDGAVVTPTNLNAGVSHLAPCDMRESAAGTAISGLSLGAPIDYIFCGANDHRELRLHDALRLGEGDAIALEYDEGALGTGDTGGVVFFYFES